MTAIKRYDLRRYFVSEFMDAVDEKVWVFNCKPIAE